MISLEIVGPQPATDPSGFSEPYGGWFEIPNVTFFAACSRANNPVPPDCADAVPHTRPAAAPNTPRRLSPWSCSTTAAAPCR